VDVEFVRLEDEPVGSVRFLLWGDGEGGDLIADITVDGEDLPDRGAYPFFFAPIASSKGQAFVWRVQADGVRQKATIAVLRVTEEGARGGPAFAAYSTQLQLVDIRQGVRIYRNPNVLPRAYVADHAEVVSGQGILERLTASDFNPWVTALLEEPLPADKGAGLASTSRRSLSTARVVRYQPNRVEIEAEMAAPGLLILSDAYYPGWTMTVDGQPAPLLRVNYALRGGYLSPGTHYVVFRFAPVAFYIGLAVTCAALAAGTGVLIACFVSTRRS
jgi:hypothetical protein